jgi:hypothetical protein
VRHDVSVNPDYERLKACLIAAREARGWFQKGLIDASGLGSSTVQRLEASPPVGPVPSRTTRLALERTLGWGPGSIEAILAGGDPTPLPEAGTPDDEPHPELPATQVAQDRDGMQIIALAVAGMAQLNPTQLRRVLADIHAELAADPLDEPSDNI